MLYLARYQKSISVKLVSIRALNQSYLHAALACNNHTDKLVGDNDDLANLGIFCPLRDGI